MIKLSKTIIPFTGGMRFIASTAVNKKKMNRKKKASLLLKDTYVPRYDDDKAVSQ